MVRVVRSRYQWHGQKSYYLISSCILEPRHLHGTSITGRIYCMPKVLWKLNWFLQDFGYDLELLDRDEIDDKALIGLVGVVKISHVVQNGASLLNFDGFAPASQWEQVALSSSAEGQTMKVAR
jgi:hypothetical protein